LLNTRAMKLGFATHRLTAYVQDESGRGYASLSRSSRGSAGGVILSAGWENILRRKTGHATAAFFMKSPCLSLEDPT
jgi:preprotein translocase subunit SecG